MANTERLVQQIYIRKDRKRTYISKVLGQYIKKGRSEKGQEGELARYIDKEKFISNTERKTEQTEERQVLNRRGKTHAQGKFK